MEKKFMVALTEEQARIIISLIDCFTDETEQDYFLNEDGRVCGMADRSESDIQSHLDKYLDHDRLDY